MSEIAVVLPVYNGLKYLEENVQSVLRQRYTNFIFYIADDCSTDGSWEFLNSVADPRIRLIRNDSNKGLFPTLNLLCRRADAKLIKLWSQDDVMKPDCLGEIVQFHKQYPDISFSYTAIEHIDEDGNILPGDKEKDATPEYIPRKLHDWIALYTGSIAGNICNVTILKSKLEEVGFFDESMIIAADFDMWVKLTEKNNIGMVKKPLILQRTHRGQLSKAPEYFIKHMTEEKKIFNALLERVDARSKEYGKRNIKWKKNPLYFSFMLQTIRKRNWKVVRKFYKELSEGDNVFLLAIRWAVLKLSRFGGFRMKQENDFLFDEYYKAQTKRSNVTA